MAFSKLRVLCGVLLCVGLALLPPIQGKSVPADIAPGAPTFSPQNGDSWTDAKILIRGWSVPAPFPAAWLPSDSAPTVKSRRAMRRLLGSTPTPTLPANFTEPPEPASEKMCRPPPACKWAYDKDGVAHSECTAPPRESRFLGLCPDNVPTFVVVAFIILALWFFLALYMWQVSCYAITALPDENPWTGMCCLALVLGLCIGLYDPMPYRIPLEAASSPGQPNVCIPPPKCSWGHDTSGEDRPVCTAPPHDTPGLVPFLGVICPHQVSTYLITCVCVVFSTIAFASLKLGLLVTGQGIIVSVLPRGILEHLRIPWTSACCYVFALALMVGIACRTQITFETI